MVPWELVEQVAIPGGAGELGLFRRGQEFSVRVGTQELMNSRQHGSEEALGRLVGRRLEAHPGPRVLVGGLGLGFTLAALLEQVGAGAAVQVAELVPAVVRWNREVLGELAGHPLADPRVSVVEQDVTRLIDAGRARYHAILLDVDNGPASLTRRENRWLYSPAGLAAARRVLRPDGLWAVWSAQEDAVFARRLGRAGFEVEQMTVPARRGGKGARHVLWIGRRE